MAPRTLSGRIRSYGRRVCIAAILGMMGSSLEAAAEFIIRSRVVNGTTYLYLTDVAGYFDWNVSHQQQNYLFSSPRHRLELTMGNRLAKLNGVVGYFSYSPLLDQQLPLISERDFTLLIDPIYRNDSLPAYSVNRIVIDPGHGGKDKGAAGSAYLEKNINLLLAKRLQAYLEKAGFKVMLTRTSDVFIELADRGVITKNWKGDLFISIHCNSASNKQVAGIETFLVTPKGAPSTSKSNVETNLVDGNTFDKLNARLAYEIHRRAIDATRANDRGIKYYRWQVLREARCPAVLLETGFLSHRGEEQKLANPTYQTQLTASIAQGIVAFTQALKPRER